MNHLTRTLFICAFACIYLPSNAQEGSLDPTFNPSDIGYGNGDGANVQLQSVVVQPDGKIIFGGILISYNGTLLRGVARVNPDGSLDNTFEVGTGVNMTFVQALDLQTDGKVIVGGGFTSFNGIPHNGITRLNNDGSVDPGFDPGSGANSMVQSAVLQTDGKILIAGNFTEYDGTSRNRIARLNSDGSLDTSFDPGIGANDPISSLVIQPDGKFIIGGSFTTVDGAPRNHIARLNADGSLDTGFDVGTGANSDIRSLALQADGRVIISGVFTSYNGTMRIRIARLNVDGSLDPSFDPGNSDGAITSAVLQLDGKIIVGGNFSNFNGVVRNGIVRLNSDASVDLGFDPGTGTYNSIYGIAIQPDGKAVLVGAFSQYNGVACGAIARINSNGTLDQAFNMGTGSDAVIQTTEIQPDGKIIIGGRLSRFNGTICGRIARLNVDGSLDASFASIPGANHIVYDIALQDDGKMIVVGSFTEYDGIARNSIVRLNSDGSLDTSFNPGAGADGTVLSALVQTDGKIIIAGGFFNYAGTSRNSIARLNSNGTLDTSFDPGTGANEWIRSVVATPDGKLIIVGDFYTYDGVSRRSIARLNDDGSLDPTFDAGPGSISQLFSLAVQPDGNVIIGGSFNVVNGVPRNGIARLNVDGSLDTSFDPGIGTGSGSRIWTTTLQPDGKLLIGGNFWFYDGVSRKGIARVNIDGSLDTSFDPGYGANEEIKTIALQDNGGVIIGGFFTAYDSIGRNRIARLYSGGFNAVGSLEQMDLMISPNPSDGHFSVTSSTSGLVEITVTDLVGNVVLFDRVSLSSTHGYQLDIEDRASGAYVLTTRSEGRHFSSLLIKQ